ncbi:MAG: hypothetical protein E1N59_1378 [Puniceicoccaceae bacterium 5H]|nr:MAG: hypothetical protein E1N59_1378 [Puniceicoccaceae bacterium 5H]
MTGGEILIAILAGAGAALIMHWFMRLVSLSPSIDVDMVRVVSVVIQHNPQGSSYISLLIHLGLGSVFGLLYALALSWFGDVSVLAGTLMGAGLGFYQGITVAFALMYGTAETLPDNYRRASMQVGVVHTVAHVIFGTILGLVLSLV